MTHKKYIINKEFLLENMRNNWKKCLLLVGVFIIIGICFSCYQVVNYKYDFKANAFTEETINLGNLNRDHRYYEDATNLLLFKYTFLNIYIDYYYQNLNIENDSKEKLYKIDNQLYRYQEKMDYMLEYYSENTPVLISEKELRLDQLEHKESKILKDNKELEIKLKELDKGYSRYYKADTEEQILYDRSINCNELEQIRYEYECISNMSLEELENVNMTYENILENNVNDLNLIIKKFNKTLKDIAAKECYSITRNEKLYNKYNQELNMFRGVDQADIRSSDKDSAITYATSVPGKENLIDLFFAYFTFVFLVGLVVSILFCLLHVEQKKKQSLI